ncbi:DNA binding methylated-DNA--cysteine S-methyltransferase [Sistotremastrum suecicum HHB10207 ss-3]|uniref:DNA binding methylated-DNA--cysteine S-methyltransferase n=1 Tax=Sistotremastrum suecicum HHB10207 ss-3 TaxID=1314776 RepID=A0A166DZA1_9AGAM|nr:DNA binding methylated-DNA--cysteine S-methyltransferase [Sistotremastrum suecicum HHB10207 ss-3]
MDAAEFHAAVYRVVRQIPPGKVTSYGHIAKLVGMPRHSRHVGQALKYLDPQSNLPWYRVISSSGQISSRGPGTSGARRQRDELEAEGIEVTGGEVGLEGGNDGGGRVNLRTYGWFPDSVDFGEVQGDEDLEAD